MQINPDKYFLVENNPQNRYLYNDPNCTVCLKPVFEKQKKIYAHAKKLDDTKWHLICEVCLSILIQDAKATTILCPQCRKSINVLEHVRLIDKICHDFVLGVIAGLVFTTGICASQVYVAFLRSKSPYHQDINNHKPVICYTSKYGTRCDELPDDFENFKKALAIRLRSYELEGSSSSFPKETELAGELDDLKPMPNTLSSTSINIVIGCSQFIYKTPILTMPAMGCIMGLGAYLLGTKPIESSELPSLFLVSALAGGLSRAIGGCAKRIFQEYNNRQVQDPQAG